MKLSKNDDIKLNIDSLTSEGSGIGRYDGFAVFVRGVVPGDEITAHIIKCSKTMQLQLLRILLNLRNTELKAIARFQINAADARLEM